MSDLPDWSGRNNEVPHASPAHFLEIFAVAIRVEAEARPGPGSVLRPWLVILVWARKKGYPSHG
jgi:hypothetical protein